MRGRFPINEGNQSICSYVDLVFYFSFLLRTEANYLYPCYKCIWPYFMKVDNSVVFVWFQISKFVVTSFQLFCIGGGSAGSLSLSLSIYIVSFTHRLLIRALNAHGGNGFVLYDRTGQNLLNDSLLMFFFCYWISGGKSSVIRRKDLYRNATERNVKPSTKVNVICIPSSFFGGQREEVVGRWTSWTGWFSPV